MAQQYNVSSTLCCWTLLNLQVVCKWHDKKGGTASNNRAGHLPQLLLLVPATHHTPGCFFNCLMCSSYSTATMVPVTLLLLSDAASWLCSMIR